MVESIKAGSKKTNTLFYGFVFCTVVIVLASILIQTRSSPPVNKYLSKKISSKKPYETFEEFYLHYLREHSQKTTRQFHYIGTTLVVISFLVNPILLIPILAGGLSSYSVMPFFRHLPNGLYEMALFMIIYLIGGKLLTRSFEKVFLPLLLGYGFAWIGHFYFEHNKPATFIYPSFSFMSDFRMMYDAIREQLF
ncbi:unnamed protein product [Rotaria sp. Silwood2]|nr:unnamed protein product [Rotaria sp. Silwood2]CAF2510921.1 unnamed protein product [Rotaria sp. Silwood2]CAF2743340.1 unnamed protein product [Rotaria sp. Silwood2]CAF2885837.1 unnamed protein product [Rotaria sp. Silwood2]CAF4030700.1 unnamed protein product [Rotaria sp. Silwood2]